jgi:hypothetical protein
VLGWNGVHIHPNVGPDGWAQWHDLLFRTPIFDDCEDCLTKLEIESLMDCEPPFWVTPKSGVPAMSFPPVMCREWIDRVTAGEKITYDDPWKYRTPAVPTPERSRNGNIIGLCREDMGFVPDSQENVTPDDNSYSGEEQQVLKPIEVLKNGYV